MGYRDSLPIEGGMSVRSLSYSVPTLNIKTVVQRGYGVRGENSITFAIHKPVAQYSA
jgi:hypothetical protein